ncbi:alkaline phosphatase [Dyadobacter sp. LHD-138]|uniref:alkaline phosphatase n=1 Tax=Dyadobacter sp. LHD-138 TaxID=3071413 RepID=UPI0027DF52FC|nr:alkaline phosphatase [Dyadobacter sp. LHD-138]MDQ6480766.1 alkaline phosphatase [Dyadobacter sp. LHD-138]
MEFIRLSVLALLFTSTVYAQSPVRYTTAQAHSHNDYEQNIPFLRAYNQQFGSIEADIFLRNDSIFVAHEQEHITAKNTLSSLYLKPLLAQFEKNNGQIYPDKSQPLQLLIDLKTPGKETIPVLIRELQPYLKVFAPAGPVKIVLSGDVPAPQEFSQYPDYLFFDGRPEINYSKTQLERIGLISQSFGHYTKWNGKGILVKKEKEALEAVMKHVHDQGKKIRFWGTPDNINAWKMLMNMGIDYLNTDKVEELGPYLRNRADAEYTSPKAQPVYKPTYRNNDKLSKVKNIILLIGDGMGLTQIYSGLTANHGELNLAQFLNIGFSKTSAADSYITDSAAGATAMATGKKARNRAIGVDTNNIPLKNLPDIIRPLGIKTGLISAGSITDATPAAFYAHQPERSLDSLIAHDYLKSSVEIMIGGGAAMFNKEKVSDSLRVKGFQVSNHWQDLASLKAPFVLLDDSKTVSMQKGRGNFLTEAFNKTQQTLSKNPKGFFMMAEGAQIDYGGHVNKIPYVVTEMLDFDQLIGEALRFADSNGETLVIVTADHETGGLTLLDGDLKKGYVDGHFSTNDHTAVMVPVFAYGPHALDFRGVYENTEIFHRILAIFNKYNKK